MVILSQTNELAIANQKSTQEVRTMGTWIIAAILLILAVLAIRNIIKTRKAGGCSGCSGSCGGGCSCCSHAANHTNDPHQLFIDNPFFYSFFLKTGSVFYKRSLSSFYKDYTAFLIRTLSAIRQATQPNNQPNSPPQRTSVGK